MATNNNLIPINIKDLPKLDILSNSDLIPIETVEGTATILYRDFIIDEAHTTFAATLSASVANAITLSAAIDTTNATVKTVSASLYSSITGLSSSSFAYSNALSSSLVSLNATVTALSSNVNTLSSTVAVNTTNITTLSTTASNLQTAVVAVTGSQPVHFALTNSVGPIGQTSSSFFDAAAAIFSLQASKVYRLQYFLIYSKQTAGTVTFTVSGSNPVNLIAGNIMHSRFTDASTAFGTISGALINVTNTSAVNFPTTYTITAGESQFVNINFIIQTSTTVPSVVLTVSSSAGTVTPLQGSTCTVTKLN